MIYFQSDYLEGAHPKILQRLTETNLKQTVGYGEDDYCVNAAQLIQEACGREEVKVHFLVGGTQTNLTVIDAALRSHQGVLCAVSGHINVHETGAVEACGHKVTALPSQDGKIYAGQIKAAYEAHYSDSSYEHMVQPKMVYISNPTELGTLYTKQELTQISKVCKECGLYLFMDGARLGYGLAAPNNDLTLQDIASLCDVFTIGGTKVGALFGEAVVIGNQELCKDFRYFIKQRGGMLAKGRLLGIQFETLFTENLYLELGEHAILLAEKLRNAFDQKGYRYLVVNRTNQIFPIIPDADLEKLSEQFTYCYQERVDNTHSAVRFCTSWATREEHVNALIKALETL